VGQGAFPHLLNDGQKIYDRRLSLTEAQARLQNVYCPHRLDLDRLVLKLRQHFSVIAHLSCFSTRQDCVADVYYSSASGEADGDELVAVLNPTAHNFGLILGALKKPHAGSLVRETGDVVFGIHSVEMHFHPRLHAASDYRNLSD
jgi:N-formylglutamate amidohydrolase